MLYTQWMFTICASWNKIHQFIFVMKDKCVYWSTILVCVSLTAPINYVRWQPNEKKMTTMKKNCLHALRHEHIHIKATNALLHCLLYWKMNEMWFCGQLTKESENTDNCVKALFYCIYTYFSALSIQKILHE